MTIKEIISTFITGKQFYICEQGCGSVSGSGLDPGSIGSVDPDPGGQK
jgi:hypothetical protein